MLTEALKAILADVEALVANFKTTLLVVLLVVLTFWVTRCQARKGAVTAERVSVLTHTIKVSVPVYLHDTVTAYRTRIRYDSTQIRDTVMRHDSVFVYKPLADTAIHACTQALHDCDHLRLLNDSLTVQLKKQAPTFWSKIGCTVGPGLQATSGGKVYVGVGATCGYKVWP